MSLSIIEFLVYGVVGYGTLIFIISLIVKHDSAKGFDRSLLRSAFIFPGLICIGILMLFGTTVEVAEINTSGTETRVNGGNATNISKGQSDTISIELQNPAWVLVHLSFFIIVFLYFIVQIAEIVVKAVE